MNLIRATNVKITFRIANRLCHQIIEGTFTEYAESQEDFFEMMERDGHDIERIRIIKTEEVEKTS